MFIAAGLCRFAPDHRLPESRRRNPSPRTGTAAREGSGIDRLPLLPGNAAQQCDIFRCEPKAQQLRIFDVEKRGEDTGFGGIVAGVEQLADERRFRDRSGQGYRSHAVARELNAHGTPLVFVGTSWADKAAGPGASSSDEPAKG